METTLNIHADILEKIAAAAKSQGMSCSKMIMLLMQKVMSENKKPIVIGRLVQYQKRSSIEKWHTFHIQFREDEYEYFLDLRKFLKMSVSLILAYAVKKFLGGQNLMDITDNNRHQYKNYVVVMEFISNIPCWKLIWGYPHLIEKHISL